MTWLKNFFQSLLGQSFSGSIKPLTRDLTADAEAGCLDPVIGRDDEIDRLVHIIARRSKNNPLLIGEAGVGKTAVVEGLAQRIARHEVPPVLKDKRVFALSLPDLMSGTGYRGELEQRLRDLIAELNSLGGKAILFVDELHMIHQAQGAQGGLNISDMLKPALARSDFAFIGATTWNDYENTLKNDPAIVRRFQPVLIGEPSRDTAVAILRGLRPEYEKYHGVRIEDAALEAAVDLSLELIRGRFLPDKAIDLMDEAAAKVSIEASLGHRVVMSALDAASRGAAERIRAERAAVAGEVEHLSALEKAYPQDPGIIAAEQELTEHLEQLDQAEQATESKDAVPVVTVADVKEVIADWRRYYEEQPHQD